MKVQQLQKICHSGGDVDNWRNIHMWEERVYGNLCASTQFFCESKNPLYFFLFF